MKLLNYVEAVFRKNKLSAVSIVLISIIFLLRKRRRRSKNLIRVSERHLKPVGHGAGTLIELGQVEKGIVELSQNMKGAMKVGLLLRLTGPHLDSEKLSFALNVLQKRHPLLRSKLVRVNQELFLKEDASLRITVNRYLRKNPDSYLDVWMERSRIGAQLNTSLLEIHLFEGDSNSEADMLFVMDHAFCDGLSITNLSSELLKILSGTEDFDTKVSLKLAKPLDALCLTGLDSGFPGSFVRIKKTFKILVSALLKKTPAYYPVGTMVKPMDMAEKCTCNPHTVEVENVKGLLTKCKANKVTLGNLITACFAYEIGQVIKHIGEDDRKLSLSVVADTRKLYASPLEYHHLGFHVSSRQDYQIASESIPDQKTLSEEDFWNLARDVKAYYQGVDEKHPLYLAQFLAPYFTYTAGTTHDTFATLAITNWGRLNIGPEFGSWEVKDIFGLTNNLHMLMPTLIVSSFRGRLRMSNFVSEPAASRSRSIEIMNAVKERMVSMIESP
mmetsp:Transcript_6047/g.7902  ORF Transcript_6047/g.7902 Transcript_6047/m.7902 type:complete len:500 (+) Transcript_6047:183-1682(+)